MQRFQAPIRKNVEFCIFCQKKHQRCLFVMPPLVIFFLFGLVILLYLSSKYSEANSDEKCYSTGLIVR